MMMTMIIMMNDGVDGEDHDEIREIDSFFLKMTIVVDEYLGPEDVAESYDCWKK